MIGPENLAATYIITQEATGEVVMKGEAMTTDTYGELEVSLKLEDTDLFDIGSRYILTILGKSPDVAFISETNERFVVKDPLIIGLSETVHGLTGDIDELSKSLSIASSDVADSITSLSNLIELHTGSIAENIEELSRDIGTVAHNVFLTQESISKLSNNSNMLIYAVAATLIVTLIKILNPYLKRA
jgi:uncharacterized protein YoxC